MLVDLLFVVAVVGLLIAIYKLKFSKENLTKDIEEEAARVARQKEEERRREAAAEGGEEREREKEERPAETNANSEVEW